MRMAFAFPISFLVGLLCFSLSAQAQIKNTQSVLGGALTRAGNKNMKQLDDQQLAQLCEQGYSSAYFMYEGAQARTVNCSRGSITYSSTSISSAPQILQNVSSSLRGHGGKVFVHCYNGAHASGYVAAVAMKQFCGLSSDQAFAYWKKTLGGYDLSPKGKASIQKRIANYSVDASLTLSASERSQLCN